MGDRWVNRPKGLPPVLVIAVCLLTLAGCATVPENEYQAALEQISRLEEELEQLQRELATAEERVAEATGSSDEALADAEQTQSELQIALSQLGELREERQALLDTVSRLEAALQDEGPQSIASILLEDEAAAGQARTQRPENARSEALAGRGGFLRTDELGLQSQPRVASRFAASAPALAADVNFGVTRVFDARLDYQQTVTFLMIEDPTGSSPRLSLHAQYVTNEAPLYLRSVFISIEGRDPVDPIDPIVLTGEPERRTDGVQLLESISQGAGPDLADRLTLMVSSSRFTVTFVGIGTQFSYRPSVTERAALSNILFAYFDLAAASR